MQTDGMFSSNSHEWETPQDLYDELNSKYHRKHGRILWGRGMPSPCFAGRLVAALTFYRKYGTIQV